MSRNVKRFVVINVAAAVILACLVAVAVIGLLADKSYGAEGPAPSPSAEGPAITDPGWKTAAFWSAALATGISCIAAGIAVGMTGSAAIGAVAERPEIMGRTILFVVFAEGLAIYGLVVSFIILTKV